MTRKLLWGILVGISFFLALYKTVDTDFGWHLRCGIDLIHGNPCIRNSYSYYLAEYRAYYPSFLYDLFLAFLYNTGGFLLINIINAIVFSVMCFFLMRQSKNYILMGIAFNIGILLSDSILSLGFRAQILTLAGCIFSYILFDPSRKSLRFCSFYPIVVGVWASTHIGFFTGLLFPGIALTHYAIQWMRTRSQFAFTSLRALSWINVASILATFINPFGLYIYLELYRHATSHLDAMIAEWIPPSYFHLILIILLTILLMSIRVTRKKISWYHICVLIITAILALNARRNLPIFYFIAMIQAAILMADQFEIPHSLHDMLVPFFASALVFSVWLRAPDTIRFSTNTQSQCHSPLTIYPCALIEHNPYLHGNIFAPYEYGGYLIWKLPKSKVFIDGRMPAWKNQHNQSPYEIYLSIVQAKDGWNELLKATRTDYIITNKGTFLDVALKDDTAHSFGWRLQYEDDFHVLYKKMR